MGVISHRYRAAPGLQKKANSGPFKQRALFCGMLFFFSCSQTRSFATTQQILKGFQKEGKHSDKKTVSRKVLSGKVRATNEESPQRMALEYGMPANQHEAASPAADECLVQEAFERSMKKLELLIGGHSYQNRKKSIRTQTLTQDRRAPMEIPQELTGALNVFLVASQNYFQEKYSNSLSVCEDAMAVLEEIEDGLNSGVIPWTQELADMYYQAEQSVRSEYAIGVLESGALSHTYVADEAQCQKLSHAPLQKLFPISNFGLRHHPILKEQRFHRGVDFRARQGTRVMAANAGKVSFSGFRSGYGLVIDIKHPSGCSTRYAHLQKSHVRVGQHVRANAIIGLSGQSGRVTGPHLHFELRTPKGEALAPMPFLK